jgi:hypothetical protein
MLMNPPGHEDPVVVNRLLQKAELACVVGLVARVRMQSMNCPAVQLMAGT